MELQLQKIYLQCIKIMDFLFSQVNAVETKVENDSITVEIRIREDEKARIRKVTVSGNDKTNDHVIFRELRVKPGDLFSRSKLLDLLEKLVN